jgi:hypothetical protein
MPLGERLPKGVRTDKGLQSLKNMRPKCPFHRAGVSGFVERGGGSAIIMSGVFNASRAHQYSRERFYCAISNSLHF